MENIKIGKYKHFKGMTVNVVGIALHSETMEEMVVYIHPDPVKGEGANTMWVRPKAMFLENVTFEGRSVPRFEYLNS